MVDKEIVLTVHGLKKLEDELELLKTVKRKEIAERIKQSIAFGDISENSEYDEAKNDQAQIEDRIKKLEDTLNTSDSDVFTSRQETDILVQQNKLYYGKYLSVIQKYDEVLDILNQIDLLKAEFSQEDNAMYMETIAECKKNISISLLDMP